MAGLACDGVRPCSMCIATNKQHQCYGVEVGSSTGRSKKRQRQEAKDTKPAVVGATQLPSAIFQSSTVNPALFYNSPNTLLSTSDWQSRVQQQQQISQSPPQNSQSQIPQLQTQPSQSLQQLQLQAQQGVYQIPVTPGTPLGNSIIQPQHQVMVYPRPFGSQVRPALLLLLTRQGGNVQSSLEIQQEQARINAFLMEEFKKLKNDYQNVTKELKQVQSQLQSYQEVCSMACGLLTL